MVNLMVVLTTLLSSSLGYKILVVSPVPGKSHAILGHGLVRHLTNSGHEVTYITSFPGNFSHPLVRDVDVSRNFEGFSVANLQEIMDKVMPLSSYTFLISYMLKISVATMENENVQRLIMDPNERFDAVIAEYMFTELYSSFAAVFNCPLIWLSTTDANWMILRLTDQLPNPAYTPDIFDSGVPPFSFAQRVWTMYKLFSGVLAKYNGLDKTELEVYERLIAPVIHKRRSIVPSFEALKYNASLVLSNTYICTGEPTPLPLMFKPIGGYHVQENPGPLPQHLQRIMDDAKHGVIYFSMGSNAESKSFPSHIKQGLLKLFSKLKQTVLWKFEEKLSNASKNVHILQWAPQQSILAHPNCVLFITHGGILSITEAVYYGIPIVGIPLYTDQFNNVDTAVKKGYARKVDLSDALAEDLEVAVHRILTDKRYTEKAKEFSFIHHHRPLPPGRELVHWVEHVIKTRGALHMRSPALMMPWYQKMYLDLVVLLFTFLIIVLCIIRQLLAHVKNTNIIIESVKKKMY